MDLRHRVVPVLIPWLSWSCFDYATAMSGCVFVFKLFTVHKVCLYILMFSCLVHSTSAESRVSLNADAFSSPRWRSFCPCKSCTDLPVRANGFGWLRFPLIWPGVYFARCLLLLSIVRAVSNVCYAPDPVLLRSPWCDYYFKWLSHMFLCVLCILIPETVIREIFPFFSHRNVSFLFDMQRPFFPQKFLMSMWHAKTVLFPQ